MVTDDTGWKYQLFIYYNLYKQSEEMTTNNFLIVY